MKNRLQIRYHIPESLPTRAQAMVYLKESFAIGRTNSDNASLPAEPLVLLYNDTPLDIANGITEAKRLETANVLLAIGRGGDGVNIFNNQDYFVIDFAKHEEDIAELASNIENILDITKEVNDTIAEMQTAIAKNANDIAEIIKKIGEKGDNSLKDTVYGFIQGAYDAIDAEVNRADDAERELQHNIDMAKVELNQELQTESTERATQDLLLSQRIDENAKQIKENKVSSNRKTIAITGPTENGTNIDVNIDNKTLVANESGTLSVSSDALVQYAGENAINVSDITGGVKTISLVVNPNDKILTNDAQGLLATLSLKWNHADATSEKDEIQLIGKDGIVISRIDVADFIKDGILDNVVLNSADANNPYLSFTFNSVSGKETINVPVKDLVEIYFAGNGLELNENTFSIKIDNSSEVFLTVSNDGLKLSGIQTAIDNAKLEVQSVITKLTGDVSVDGSIKDIVFDSALGAIINTITVDDATEQSLVKKFTLDGTPYIYVSNNTSDMKHNGNALNTVIDELHAEVTNNKTEISVLNNEVAGIKTDITEIRENIANLENSINTTITGLLAPMQEAITALQTELANTKAELDTLKANAITSITGVANEISVTVTDNTAVVGFAEDAYFVAG